MPPKQKTSDSDIPTDRETAIEAKRIRARASPSLLQPHAPPHTAQIPTSLRKSDGADIIKRNANRKKKYLFIFPGALSLPATGGTIGSLASLDTRNPILNIEFPFGTLRLIGTLVFPKNAFISVKPAKRAVQVMDVFETMIVFSEWRWVGDLTSNPGGVPVPVPDAMKGPEEDLWRSAAVKPKPRAEGSDAIQISSEGESSVLVDSEEDGWAATKTVHVAPLRSNPRRKGRVINYSQLEDDQSHDDSGKATDRETNSDAVRGVKRRSRRSGPKDIDDSLQIVEDVDTEEVKPGRASRRKVGYSVESSGEAENDGYLDEKEGGSVAENQYGERILQLDDSVELIETVKGDDPEKKTRRASRRTRRKIIYSQESGDEYGVDEEEDDDEDFAADGGEESDVLGLD